MRISGKPTPASSRNRLRRLLTAELGDAYGAVELLDEFLGLKSYSAKFCLRLLDVARGVGNQRWEVRRLAVLMLEHQILKLQPDNLEAFDVLLSRLNLKQPGINTTINRPVLQEGFTTTSLRPFVIELQVRLGRLNRVHNQLRRRKSSARALREFLRLSRSDCKLSLARYLFSPDEVAQEIFRQVRITAGVRDVDPGEPRHVKTEMEAAIEGLPDFEARVLRRLCETGDIYWVGDETSSELNSLVEYPATTVVLVIKLPGSDIEFEIKRAGRRGDHALNVVYARNGYTVPPSHRLDGGSMQSLLRYEANNGPKLSAIYRLVHSNAPPIANYIARSTVNAIPTRAADIPTLRYFTEPHMFGEGFQGMRRAMKESVDAFRSEGHGSLPEVPCDLGLTAQFIGQVSPAQAIITGSSSFRLDKIASYLSEKGPDIYFKQGLGIPYSKQDAKFFADTVLEEVLGVFQPPPVNYQSHPQYVTAAFALKENRRRADAVYLSLIKQIAKFWGTVLGVRGYSRGESFVARNVGLRSCWINGRWDVRVIFMDHDALVIPNSRSGRFFAHGDVPNMTLDERYIWARLTEKRFAASEVGCLHAIYQVGKQLDQEGQALARIEMRKAYQKTQHEVMTNPRLHRLFSKGVVERLRDWDTLVSGYLRMNGDKAAARKWKREMKGMLARNGYRPDMFDAYVATIEKNRDFLSRQAFLFEPTAEKRDNLDLN